MTRVVVPVQLQCMGHGNIVIVTCVSSGFIVNIVASTVSQSAHLYYHGLIVVSGSYEDPKGS